MCWVVTISVSAALVVGAKRVLGRVLDRTLGS